MFQVDLHISPSRGEIDIYLDEQLKTVDYKGCIESQAAKRTSIYELFRGLIIKYGGRNPREIKRLINSSLIRGAGAEKIQAGASTLTFEQGVSNTPGLLFFALISILSMPSTAIWGKAHLYEINRISFFVLFVSSW